MRRRSGCGASAVPEPERRDVEGNEGVVGKVSRLVEAVQIKMRERAAVNVQKHADPSVAKATKKVVYDVFILRSVLPLCSAAVLSAEFWDLSQLLRSMAMSMSKIIEVYSVILIVKILLSWFPNFNMRMEPFRTIDQITEPFFLLFRSLLPPFFGIDFTPIIGMMALSWLQGLLFEFGYVESKAEYKAKMMNKLGLSDDDGYGDADFENEDLKELALDSKLSEASVDALDRMQDSSAGGDEVEDIDQNEDDVWDLEDDIIDQQVIDDDMKGVDQDVEDLDSNDDDDF